MRPSKAARCASGGTAAPDRIPADALVSAVRDFVVDREFRIRHRERRGVGKVGAEVARRLGYTLGQRIVLSHGDGAMQANDHADKPFTIVGILAPTGTPVDRTVHISLQAMEAIHLDWVAGVPLPRIRSRTTSSSLSMR